MPTECRVESELHRAVVGRLTLRGLCERLVCGPRISNHRKSPLPEDCLDLVSEISRTDSQQQEWPWGSSKLQHSLVASISGGQDTDVSRVFSGINGMAQAARTFSQILFRFMR